MMTMRATIAVSGTVHRGTEVGDIGMGLLAFVTVCGIERRRWWPTDARTTCRRCKRGAR